MRRYIEKVKSLTKKAYLKILYRNKIEIGERFNCRKRLEIIICGGKVRIGNRVFINNDCTITSLGNITIGNDCMIGEGVKIYDHNHRFRNVNKLIRDQGMKVGKVEIGNNCWIGSNVIILSNVKIGNNVIISAGCVIDRSIPSDVIVKGERNTKIERR